MTHPKSQKTALHSTLSGTRSTGLTEMTYQDWCEHYFWEVFGDSKMCQNMSGRFGDEDKVQGGDGAGTGWTQMHALIFGSLLASLKCAKKCATQTMAQIHQILTL